MEKEFEDRLYELKKIISVLQWDIDHMQNNSLKSIKQNQLNKYKEELILFLDKFSFERLTRVRKDERLQLERRSRLSTKSI